MKYSYTKEKLQEIVSYSKSIAEVCRKLHIKAAGGNYHTLKSKFREWDIDICHFTGRGWNIGLKFKPSLPKNLDEILKINSKYQSYKLKNRLIKEGLKEHKCECCQLKTWGKRQIPLELHHVNGDKFDNRIYNLQLLCPNCHAQTDNYRGKNKRVAQKVISEVEDIKFSEGLTANTEPSHNNMEGAET